VDPYLLELSLLGLILLGAVWLPRAVARYPLSYPLLYVLFGYLVIGLPLGLTAPDPVALSLETEKLTELVVILSLTGAGLKIYTPFSWRRWGVPWRLLGVTMPLCIGAAAVLAWGWLGLVPASALLLAAALAPTDPVLASDVQVGRPNEGDEHPVRFSLTAEAGFNDGLAFPFVYLAILLSLKGLAPSGWLAEFALFYLLYKVVAGILLGRLLGRLLALFIFRLPGESRAEHTQDGLMALAMTLLVYGVTELLQGYGFLAVFVAAMTVRQAERNSRYHAQLHDFAEQIERLIMVVLMVLFGAALQGGLLGALEPRDALFGLVFLLLVRPLLGFLGLIGSRLNLRERLLVSFFGIRGLGSFYYLAYALNQGEFSDAEHLWAISGFVVLVSVMLHGATATPFMRNLREKAESPG
jgi:sodium/hydrogen antiporter